MKRRGFLAGAVSTALSGAFIVRNPTVLDNGLVVPASASEEVRSDRADLVDVIVPKEPTKPIAVATSDPIPASARFVGTLDYANLTVSSDPVDITAMGDPYRKYVQAMPVEVELNMRVVDGGGGWFDVQQAMNKGEEVEVYLVRRKKRDWPEISERSGIQFAFSTAEPLPYAGTVYMPYGGKTGRW